MEKLFVVQCTGGNMTIVSEWNNNPNGAKQAFHNQCRLLYSDAQTTTAYVAIFDEQLDVYGGFKEFVNKVIPETEG